MLTHEQLKHYRKDIRAEIFDFIWKLPTNIDVEVNGIKYKLVHASPEENYMTAYWYSHDYKDSREFAIWDRWDETKPVPEGYVLIFGHTPTCYFHNTYPWSIWKSDEAIGIRDTVGMHPRSASQPLRLMNTIQSVIGSPPRNMKSCLKRQSKSIPITSGMKQTIGIRFTISSLTESTLCSGTSADGQIML